jgi:predicted metal-dependent hydrolase
MNQSRLDHYFEMHQPCTQHELSSICENVYHSIRKNPETKVVAEFYPYSNIKLTINKRKGQVQVRMSDLLADAPRIVLVSAANVIISRFLNKKCSEKSRLRYREYIYSDEIRNKTKNSRKVRAKPRIPQPKGKFYDLEECFENINSKYFHGALTKPTLKWSTRKSKTNLGHYDMDLDTLIVSKKLDSKNTPKYVVEYIVYHELLHQRYPGKYKNGQWVVHTPEFKQSEKLFDNFKQANSWLKQN